MSDGNGKSYDVEADWDEQMAMAGPSVVVILERSASQAVREPDRTFSSAALDELMERVGTFIATRLARSMDSGEIPKRLGVTVTVKVNGHEAR
jgi:hypothetical protein